MDRFKNAVAPNAGGVQRKVPNRCEKEPVFKAQQQHRANKLAPDGRQ
jgi:hypothetical protein